MIAVIGAGLSGLTFAQQFKNQDSLILVEKSRGVGGRLATRRWDDARFDHGTQTLGALEHQPSAGMTSYAKKIAQGKKIFLEKKLVRLLATGAQWKLEMEGGDPILADAVVMTCPLPQSLDILDQSQINYPQRLRKVEYDKAVLALVKPLSKVESDVDGIKTQNIEAIYDQQKKGLSPVPALTVLMKNEFAQTHFENNEELLKSKVQNIFQKEMPHVSINDLQIKKWRYSRVKNPLTENFLQVHQKPPLYLAGDAFAGGDLLGAQKSAESLAVIFFDSSI
jgi:renalase